jgi:hypothetical protein
MHGISLGGIAIREIPGKRSSPVVKRDLTLLKQLITEVLKRKGIAQPSPLRTNDSEECYGRQQPDDPAVCVDIWQSM